jgi:hypothetical protein
MLPPPLLLLLLLPPLSRVEAPTDAEGGGGHTGRALTAAPVPTSSALARFAGRGTGGASPGEKSSSLLPSDSDMGTEKS